jgi:hypothetical protein
LSPAAKAGLRVNGDADFVYFYDDILGGKIV